MADQGGGECNRRLSSDSGCKNGDAKNGNGTAAAAASSRVPSFDETAEQLPAEELASKKNDRSSSSKMLNVCRPLHSETSPSPTEMLDSSSSSNNNAESTLNRLIAAAAELEDLENNETIMRRGKLEPEIEEKDLLAAVFDCYRENLAPAINYVSDLPAYAAIPISDRCRLFAHSFLPILIAQLSQPRNNAYAFLGYSKVNRDVFLTKFPNFKHFGEKVDEICQLFNSWQPTVSEMALLFAFLFYQDNLPDLIHPVLISNIHQRLKFVLNNYLKQSNSYDNRLRYFMRVVDLLRCANESYVDASVELYKSRPDLPEDQLYRELFHIQQRSSHSHQLNLLADKLTAELR